MFAAALVLALATQETTKVSLRPSPAFDLHAPLLEACEEGGFTCATPPLLGSVNVDLASTLGRAQLRVRLGGASAAARAPDQPTLVGHRVGRASLQWSYEWPWSIVRPYVSAEGGVAARSTMRTRTFQPLVGVGAGLAWEKSSWRISGETRVHGVAPLPELERASEIQPLWSTLTIHLGHRF
jgi:hypothetical protein